MTEKKKSNVIPFPLNRMLSKQPHSSEKSTSNTLDNIIDSIKSMSDVQDDDGIATNQLEQAQSIRGNNNTQYSSDKKNRTSQAIIGDHNVQVYGKDVNITQKESKLKITIPPPSNSIGDNSFLKEQIVEAFGALGLERKKRLGNTAFQVMYKNFKKDFSIPASLPWTIIWNWPEERAVAILDYLRDKLSNTIAGKIKNAGARANYNHSHKHLFKEETNLLKQLNLKANDEWVKNEMYRLFGTRTHKELDNRQHNNWVIYLSRLVDDMYEQSDEDKN